MALVPSGTDQAMSKYFDIASVSLISFADHSFGSCSILQPCFPMSLRWYWEAILKNDTYQTGLERSSTKMHSME